MTNPVVSIITPSYNSERFIYDCYNSIKSQTVSDWEWLVTDDASVDGSVRLLRAIAEKDQRVKPEFFTKNEGAARSRNCSIDRADGAYFAFLDIDDYWHPEKLATQLAVHQRGMTFTFTSFVAFKESPEKDGKIIDPGPARVFNYSDMLHKRATLGCSTVMVSRDLVGLKRMPDLRSGQDYAFWLSILKGDCAAFLIPSPMTYYRVLPNSLSRNKFKKAARQWQIYRKIEQLSLAKSVWAFKSYAINALTR